MTEIVDAESVELVPYHAPAPVTLFRSDEPGEVLVRATEAAKVLAQVIRKQKLYKTIQGKNHVFVEGWTLLGSMHGVFPIIVWTHQLPNGWEARAEARTLAGALVGAAEAQCVRSENRWGSADDYALRSMAQTRAISRALRAPLGFIVQLAGFEPDPVEDMPADAAPPQRAGGSTGKRSSQSRYPLWSSRASSAPPAAEAPPQGEGPAEESPFKAPTGPRGGQANLLEANELAGTLVELVEKLGATDSLPMIEAKREAADLTWLKRQIATAQKALERREAEERGETT